MALVDLIDTLYPQKFKDQFLSSPAFSFSSSYSSFLYVIIDTDSVSGSNLSKNEMKRKFRVNCVRKNTLISVTGL